MKISSSIPNPMQTASLALSKSAVLATPAIPIQQQAELETPAIPVAQKASLKTSIQPVLSQMVADFGALTDSQRRNPGISTVSRVDMAKLLGHSSSATLLYLTDYDPDTYTGKDGNLFIDLETSLTAGEQKVTRRFESDLPLDEEDFNNLAKKMPERYLNTERFAIQLNRFKELRVRSQQLDVNQFQEMLQEMLEKTSEEKAEQLKEGIEKSQEKTEYDSTKVNDQPIDERYPIIQKDISESDKEMLRELEARDMAVRAHEMAHMAAGAGLTGGATYTYQIGPDGRQYAIGGEVSINISEGSTPEDTMNRAKRILSAATAPTDPSAADTAVAMQATQMLAAAQVQIAQEKQEAIEENIPTSEKKEQEQVTGNLPPEPETTDPLTGTVEGQPQITQEQADQSSATFLSSTRTDGLLDAANEEDKTLASSLSDSPFRGIEFNQEEVLPIIPNETSNARDTFIPETPIIDDASNLPTFNTQDGRFVPSEPTTLDTDNLPDVKIQDATLFDIDVTTIAGRRSATETPDQTMIAEDLDSDDTSNRFVPEARIERAATELIASEDQIEQKLTSTQERTPTLDELLDAPVLLNNPLNDASPEQDEITLATENATDTVSLGSAATQAGPIATAAAIPLVEQPDFSNEPQERTTQESNLNSSLSLSQTETQTRFAVTQPAFLDLSEE